MEARGNLFVENIFGVAFWSEVVWLLYLRRGLVNSLLVPACFLCNTQPLLRDMDPSILGQEEGDTTSVFLRGGRCIYLQHSSAHVMGSNQANSWCSSSCLALFLLSRS